MTKRMFTFIKGMGHEKHTLFLVAIFNQSDHFDQVLNHTSNQEFFLKKKVHQNAHGLVKSTVLNGHV